MPAGDEGPGEQTERGGADHIAGPEEREPHHRPVEPGGSIGEDETLDGLIEAKQRWFGGDREPDQRREGRQGDRDE